MTVNIIKDNLKGIVLDTIVGRKQVLVDLFIDSVCNNVPLAQNQNEELLDNFAGVGFNEGTYWKYLNPEEHSGIINEASQNIDGLQFRSPTVPEAESSSQDAPKRNYKQNFDCPPFIQYVLKPKINSRGGLVISGIEGGFVYDRVLSDE